MYNKVTLFLMFYALLIRDGIRAFVELRGRAHLADDAMTLACGREL